MPDSLLVDHTAQLLGVSRRTVYYRIREGRLRTMRTRCGSQRVLMESILEYILGGAIEAPITPVAGVSDTDPSEKSPAP
jgi:excisionase family DNA binding protein